MKKKLKVKKAFAGKMMRAAPAQGKRVIPVKQPRPIPVKQPRPGVRPGVQPLPAAPGPLGGSVTQPAVVGEPPQSIGSMMRAATIPGNQAPMQQPVPGGILEAALRYKNAPGGLGGQINTGMQQPAPGGMAQPLPTAPSFGGPQPQGGDRFVHMFRQQAAPVQPVPAMKKGGIVRGGRAETKGTRPAKLY